MIRSLLTLKVQILLAISLLTGLFALSAFNSMLAIDQQNADAMLLRVAARLSYEQQHLTMQSMQYQESAPPDQPRDVRELPFFYEDLKASRAELDKIIGAFSNNSFNQLPETAELAEMCRMPAAAQEAAMQLAEQWQVFTAELDQDLGEQTTAPRLDKAAQTILAHSGELGRYSGTLVELLDSELSERADRARMTNRLLLGLAFLVAIGIAAWFYLRVLRPMSTAVKGFRVVANGDFAHRVPVAANNEIGWLVSAFNQLAGRLDTLRKLLTRLEQGGDLDSTLETLAETLPNLMPVDWLGVLVVGVDGRIHLERAFSDGAPDPIGQQSFDTDHTLLEECLKTNQPLHIADVQQMSQLSDRYVFLRRLYGLGRRDAIFQPVAGGGSGLKGVVVFATRYPNSYRTEHIELLRNLGPLISVSLARTLRLIDSQRLANIGQFASGIVHEIRNPLSTISLALEHLGQLEGLPPTSTKRVNLATEEIGRLERLLDDILVYAKPLVLEREVQDLAALIDEVVIEFADNRLAFEADPIPEIAIDRDRIKQILINLLRNALEANPPDETVRVSAGSDGPGWVEIRIRNGGAVISEAHLQRLFEPFFTTKQNGTGLGLPIVQRMVQAHSGQLNMTSDPENGTVATVRLPLLGVG